MATEAARTTDFQSWANPSALQVLYVTHPNAEQARVHQCSGSRNLPYVLFAARDACNVLRTLVALHPDVAADLLRYHSGGLADGCFGGEARALLLAAEDVGVDLMALAARLI